MSKIINIFGSLTSAFAPTQLADLRLWLDADDLSTITKDGGGMVSSWTDKSSNVYDFQQVTASNQPLYVANGYGTNSKAHLLFDNVNDFLVNSAFSVGDCTVFVIYKNTAAKNGATIIADDSEKNNLRIYSQSGNYAYFHSNPAEVQNLATSLNTDYIAMFSRQPSGSGISQRRLNGGAYGQGAFTNSDITTGLKIGNWYTTSNRYFGGQIAEIIIYDNVLSNADSDLVFDYINSKYGIY